MKKILFCLATVISAQGLAAVTHQKLQAPQGIELAQEILSMPEANRKQIALEKGSSLYPTLIQISKSEDQSMSTRWKALTLAAFLEKEKSVNELEANIKSSDWFMRNAALVSLKTYHPLKAKAAAHVLLKDKALVVRSAAVEVLGGNLDPKSRDLLWEEFSAKYNFRKQQGLWIREQILSQLAQNPREKEGALFVKALQEKDSKLHLSAMKGLEKITQQSLGKPNQKLAERRTLWLQWAKANPDFVNR